LHFFSSLKTPSFGILQGGARYNAIRLFRKKDSGNSPQSFPGFRAVCLLSRVHPRQFSTQLPSCEPRSQKASQRSRGNQNLTVPPSHVKNREKLVFTQLHDFDSHFLIGPPFSKI